MCAAITFQTIEKHLYEGHIHFSFLIKKNSKEPYNLQLSTTPSDKKDSEQQKKSLPFHSVPNKGILKANTLRKTQSVPDAAKSSQVTTTTKKDMEPFIDSYKSLPPMRQNSNPPDYSSINKVEHERHTKSPAHCTSAINKNDDEFVSTFFYWSIVIKDEHCQQHSFLFSLLFLFCIAWTRYYSKIGWGKKNLNHLNSWYPFFYISSAITFETSCVNRIKIQIIKCTGKSILNLA